LKKTYDYIIIGSGFGGSVSALRLAEKGYKVLVIEKGKWYKTTDFPKTNWQLKKWLWMPFLKCFGIMKISMFRHVSILSGVGVGGGSLVYANTLPKPNTVFFNTGSWSKLEDWETVLNPFYETAKTMLGATKNPKLFETDKVLKTVAINNKLEHQFSETEVGVFFGNKKNDQHNDPYFNGKGPERVSCNFCGKCMTGCPNNSKNSLDKNYLYLAQQLGVDILSEHKVIDVIPTKKKSYDIHFKKSTQYFSKAKKITTKAVVFSGGVLGTVPLLLKLKQQSMPNLSDMIGKDIRTNNEALINVVTDKKEVDFTKGIAIGSILHIDKNNHIEPVRYGKGSGFWRLLMIPTVNEKNIFKRIPKLIFVTLKQPLKWFKILTVKDYAKQSTVLLFMQNLDGKIRFKKSWFGIKTRIDKGKAPTAFIDKAHKYANDYANEVNGKPMSLFTETITGIPSTAHILGGAVMGKNSKEGVIDKHNKVFGYDNLFVCDGSMISANIGVNPSLSITAITEKAMSMIPNKK
jgi:cholesterol oxidase